MRFLTSLVVAFSCAAIAFAQPNEKHNVLNAGEAAQGKVLLFDGKTTSGWIIDGDAEVKDGVLILGGAKPTRVQIAVPLDANFELHLEYRTENKTPVNFEIEHKHWLGRGSSSRGIDRTSEKPDEWLEAVYVGTENPAQRTWSVVSKWRALGEPAFNELEISGSSERPRQVTLGYQIPVGQKLYLRTVHLKTEPVHSYAWLWIGLPVGLFLLLLVAVGVLILWKKRSTIRDNTCQTQTSPVANPSGH